MTVAVHRELSPLRRAKMNQSPDLYAMTSLRRLDSLPSDAGLLLVGHGTRHAAGAEEFLSIVRQVASLENRRPVEPCFLEFAQPSIAAGFARLVERGAASVVVVPVILFAAGHIRQDIPREVTAAAAEHAGVAVTQAAHLGCHPALVQLSTRRYDEAIASAPPVAAAETVLVMVGRGSHDPQATGEMLRFARVAARDIASERDSSRVFGHGPAAA